MRILIVSAWFPSRLHPRHGNFVMRFAELMAEHHAVEVVSVEEDGQLATGAVQVEQGQGKGYTYRTAFYGRAVGGRVGRVVNRRRAWERVLATVTVRPDIVHTHVLIDGGIIGGRWARRRSIPYVITVHATRYLRGRVGNFVERRLARRAASRAGAVLPVSETLIRTLIDHQILGDFEVLPNFVDETTFNFRPAAPRRPDGPFRLTHVSDFSAKKNVAGILEACHQLAAEGLPFQLHLAGDGDLAALGQQIQLFNFPPGYVSVSGPHSPEQIANLLRASDLFVLNSTFETQGIVLIESLLCGLPCVTNDTGGPAEVVGADPAFGAIVPASAGPAGLAAELRSWILRGPTPAAGRQSIAAQAAELYASAVVRARLEAIYAKLLHTRVRR